MYYKNYSRAPFTTGKNVNGSGYDEIQNNQCFNNKLQSRVDCNVQQKSQIYNDSQESLQKQAGVENRINNRNIKYNNIKKMEHGNGSGEEYKKVESSSCDRSCNAKKNIFENSSYISCIDSDENDDKSCECGFDLSDESDFPDNAMYAHSYVKNQVMDKVFNPEVGLKMGTIFPELVSPYKPYQDMEEIAYLKKCSGASNGCNK